MEIQTTILQETWKREEAFRLIRKYRSPEMQIALYLIHDLAVSGEVVSSDLVWLSWRERNFPAPRGCSFMGAAFKEAERKGLIASNGLCTRSNLEKKKRRNIQLWSSLIRDRPVAREVLELDSAPIIMGGGE